MNGPDRKLVAKYYRLPDGTEPVRSVIDDLPLLDQVLLENGIDRINVLCTMRSPHLPFPISSQIEGELRELRCQVRAKTFRVLYRRSEHMVILLHIFEKKTQKVPEAEKAVARERWANFRARMNAEPRLRPSPIGTGEAP